MSRGPIPMPTELKKARGNPGKRAFNDLEPTPSAGVPAKPGSLSDRASEIWDGLAEQLVAMRVLSIADGFALELLCKQMDRLEQIERTVDAEGFTVLNARTGMLHENPLNKTQLQLENQVRNGLKSFGLDPSSRTRAATIGVDKKQSRWAEVAV